MCHSKHIDIRWYRPATASGREQLQHIMPSMPIWLGIILNNTRDLVGVWTKQRHKNSTQPNSSLGMFTLFVGGVNMVREVAKLAY